MTPYFSYKDYSEYALVKAENFSIESNLESDKNFSILACGKIKISKTLKYDAVHKDFKESLERMVHSIARRYEEILKYEDYGNIEIIHLDIYIQNHLGGFFK